MAENEELVGRLKYGEQLYLEGESKLEFASKEIMDHKDKLVELKN